MTPEELNRKLDNVLALALATQRVLLEELAWHRLMMEELLGRPQLTGAEWERFEQMRYAALTRTGESLLARAESFRVIALAELREGPLGGPPVPRASGDQACG